VFGTYEIFPPPQCGSGRPAPLLILTTTSLFHAYSLVFSNPRFTSPTTLILTSFPARVGCGEGFSIFTQHCRYCPCARSENLCPVRCWLLRFPPPLTFDIFPVCLGPGVPPLVSQSFFSGYALVDHVSVLAFSAIFLDQLLVSRSSPLFVPLNNLRFAYFSQLRGMLRPWFAFALYRLCSQSRTFLFPISLFCFYYEWPYYPAVFLPFDHPLCPSLHPRDLSREGVVAKPNTPPFKTTPPPQTPPLSPTYRASLNSVRPKEPFPPLVT